MSKQDDHLIAKRHPIGFMLVELIIIATFMLDSVGVHLGLYLWVEFKVDESVVVVLFEETQEALSTENISARTQTPPARVAAVCQKGKRIERYLGRKELWCLCREMNMAA